MKRDIDKLYDLLYEKDGTVKTLDEQTFNAELTQKLSDMEILNVEIRAPANKALHAYISVALPVNSSQPQ